MDSLILTVLMYLFMVVGGLLALGVVALLLLSFVLLVVLFLQALGIMRRVPFNYNVRNLIVRWKITVLTPLVFTLVVGLLVIMCAFVQGMYKLTEGSSKSGNVMVLSDGATDELFSNLGYGDITRLQQQPFVQKDEEGRPLVSWETYMVVNQPIPNAPRQGGRQRRFVLVRGVDDPVVSGFVHGIALHPGGKWFDAAAGTEVINGGDTAVQCVLGEGLARELGPDLNKKSLEVGDLIELGPRKWKIVGIMQSAGSTFDSEVWAKRILAGQMFGKETPTTAVVRTADAAAAQEAARDITANFKSPAVQAQTEAEYFERLNGTNLQFLFATIFVAVFLALGGMAGIMITMFAAISQRIKDIGVMRILGFARWQVLVSFFLEAMMLALIGGLIGCAIGSLCNGYTTSSIVGSGQGGGKFVVLKMVVDAKVLLGGLGFALFMGAIGGLVPALSAMATRPLESLR
jgi:ABC-type lipoprotein release transport system permease subunit